MDCLFCNIVKGDIPSKKIYEDDKIIVILDVFPSVDGHSLIIPKKHFTDFLELDNDTLIHINDVAKKMTKTLMQKLDTKTITLSMNYGDRQAIKHVHLHLMPNFPKNTKTPIDDVFQKLIKE